MYNVSLAELPNGMLSNLNSLTYVYVRLLILCIVSNLLENISSKCMMIDRIASDDDCCFVPHSDFPSDIGNNYLTSLPGDLFQGTNQLKDLCALTLLS